ncbi:glycerate kinase/Entner-Doudoroff aldolase [Breznakia sp. PH1-1]|nr:glycerate kinase/Entner-Doudoroff aldolase [Breznakia sp. PH1-1]MDH6403667.1 glycerate kinase/Entner-Doudoroff aldolase [Breznakia sp. PF1-11]MDH6411376.1 glycerate kinase/Entner-Doudoroff aldolase [Breznakia sp. PFB1-11]MDH6413648.1 glycerate kinase/Entner-Doudoroff aldolase [Breznakia sp. PFB1-14]MDH6415921.1 glycerate kinase/Entner-Doudoroff aldolase [Breznakia sp. PFB1-4]MDH6418316.1 glycerate kinase/Entner-Doudoroff aldolase [Breznakia sp. PFB1-12]MDH6474337.1 glycerate kinase/Entner-
MLDSILPTLQSRIESMYTFELTGKPIEARYGWIEKSKTAIIESADTCGLTLIKKEDRNPLLQTTYGLGLMISKLVDKGAKHIVIGLGGTGTNDGGLGCICALGEVPICEVKDVSSALVLAKQSFKIAKEKLKGIQISALCDVDATYVGQTGATYMFGKQKGATNQMQKELDAYLSEFSLFIKQSTGVDIALVEKTGAAGGLSGALYSLGAKNIAGINFVKDVLNFSSLIENADLIITGEGKIDKQTIHGKVIAGICNEAKQKDIPVVTLAGSVDLNIDEMYEVGMTSAFSILNQISSLEEALIAGEQSMEFAAYNIAKLYLAISKNVKKENTMNINEIKETTLKCGVLPVIKINQSEDAIPLAKALIDGGLPAAEITFRTACASEAIANIKKAYPDMLVAAGTVITNEQADQAMQAGADFLISPGINESLIKYCQAKDYVIIPGITSASEAQLACTLGLEVVKFFPAETSGGVKAIQALSAPFPQLEFMPTGGISENNLEEYLSYSKIIGCGGSWMVKENLINEKNFSQITALVKEAISLVKNIKE